MGSLMLGKEGGGGETLKELYIRTSMGEDVTEWIEDREDESDDDSTDSEEEWHQVKDYDLAWDDEKESE